MRKTVTINELYNKTGKRYNSNIDMIKRKPLYNTVMNNDTRVRIPHKVEDNAYRLLLCIDYDPNKIIDTGILTNLEEALSGRYLDYVDKINEIIITYTGVAVAHSFEYIASRSRIDHKNRTVMIIGLSSSGGSAHDTNIYQVGGNLTPEGVLRISLRNNYNGRSYQSAINAFNSGNIPPYLQPMVSMYNYSKFAYKVITSWNNFMSQTPWSNTISTLKWLRCLDVGYINNISSLAKNAKIVEDDAGMEVFANQPLIDIEAIFTNCIALRSISHMNEYILVYDGSSDAIKSMFYGCVALTDIELLGWDISTDVAYLSMFMTNVYGQDFMCKAGNTYKLKVDETMKQVTMNFYTNGTAGNDTTEKAIYDLLLTASAIDGIYTIVKEIPSV